MVANYIQLRLKQFVRFYSFNGMHPLLGIPLTALVHVVLSALLYDKAPYADWIYAAVAMGTVTELQNDKTNNVLRQMLTKQLFFKVKLLENVMILLPFIIIMAYYQSWLPLLSVLLLIIPYSYSSKKLPKPQIRSLATPYKGYAYEGNFAFRAMFVAYIIYVGLLVVGSLVQNPYVLFIPFFILLYCLQAAYGELESPIYIWTYRMSAGKFLRQKLYTLLRNYIITFLPFLLLGVVIYNEEWQMFLFSFCIGLLSIIGSLFIKYHFYPSRIIVQISQVVFFGITIAGIGVPQMLLLSILFIVYAAYKARRNLQTILKC